MPYCSLKNTVNAHTKNKILSMNMSKLSFIPRPITPALNHRVHYVPYKSGEHRTLGTYRRYAPLLPSLLRLANMKSWEKKIPWLRNICQFALGGVKSCVSVCYKMKTMPQTTRKWHHRSPGSAGRYWKSMGSLTSRSDGLRSCIFTLTGSVRFVSQ